MTVMRAKANVHVSLASVLLKIIGCWTWGRGAQCFTCQVKLCGFEWKAEDCENMLCAHRQELLGQFFPLVRLKVTVLQRCLFGCLIMIIAALHPPLDCGEMSPKLLVAINLLVVVLLCLNLHIIHFTSTVSRIGIRIIYPVSTERMWRLILHISWPWWASSFCFGCHYWCKPAKWSFSSSVIFVVQREAGRVQLCHIFFSNLLSFCIAPTRLCLSWVWIHFLFYFINVHLHAFHWGFCSLFCFLTVVLPNHWQQNYSILLCHFVSWRIPPDFLSRGL